MPTSTIKGTTFKWGDGKYCDCPEQEYIEVEHEEEVEREDGDTERE